MPNAILAKGKYMSRTLTMCAALAAALLVAPERAMAAERFEILGASPLHLLISLAGLGVAMILLVEVMMLRKVAIGGAIAEKISYVFLAIVCLGASALAQWTRNFVHGVTLEQVNIASEVFVIVTMGLFTAYFASVRKAFEGYLTAMTGGEMLAEEDAADAEAPRG